MKTARSIPPSDPPCVVITGANGMLGQSLVRHLARNAIPERVLPLSRSACDISCSSSLLHPQLSSAAVIINCAAYTAVDRAESEEAAAFSVNRDGVCHLATVARLSGALLIHISTDFVFSGDSPCPYSVNAASAPRNVYGASKRAGEEAIIASGCRYLLIRTSWLFGHGGSNFVETILRKGAERGALQVVNDQRGRPTFADDLAWGILRLWRRGATGIFHFANQGVATWYDFACEIIRLSGLKVRISPCTSEDYATPATRPRNSVLDCAGTEAYLGEPIRSWKQSLSAYFSCRTSITERG